MRVYLETDRILLRELESSDDQNLFDLDSDPEVMRFLTNGVPSSMEYIRSALIRTRALYEKHQHRFGFWAAIERQTGEFMGWFLFRPSKADPENTGRIELGYRLKRAFWERGYATEGSLALIAKGFDEMKIDEIFAVTMKANIASQRVMEKSGLIFSREFHSAEFSESREMDVEYSISRVKWKCLSG